MIYNSYPTPLQQPTQQRFEIDIVKSLTEAEQKPFNILSPAPLILLDFNNDCIYYKAIDYNNGNITFKAYQGVPVEQLRQSQMLQNNLLQTQVNLPQDKINLQPQQPANDYTKALDQLSQLVGELAEDMSYIKKELVGNDKQQQ